MILTKEQRSEMAEAAKPLMRWLNECPALHPHCEVVVTNGSVSVLEKVAMEKSDEFIKD